jgi:hypothetical protein
VEHHPGQCRRWHHRHAHANAAQRRVPAGGCDPAHPSPTRSRRRAPPTAPGHGRTTVHHATIPIAHGNAGYPTAPSICSAAARPSPTIGHMACVPCGAVGGSQPTGLQPVTPATTHCSPTPRATSSGDDQHRQFGSPLPPRCAAAAPAPGLHVPSDVDPFT